MSQQTDRAFLEWLDEGPNTGPSEAMARAAEAVHRTDQRPSWATAEWWIPMGRPVWVSGSQRLVLATVLAALLMAAVVGVLLLAGAWPRPVPLGGNGAIVVDVGSTLYQLEPDGSGPAALTIGLGHAYSPTFSPDGSRFAFLSRAGDAGPFSIFVARADARSAVNVTGAMEVNGAELAGITWTPDATRIVFESSEGDVTRLYTVGVDGSGLRPLFDGSDSRKSPTISPDGTWLAYQLQSPTGDGADFGSFLAVSRADGSDERRLLSVPAMNASFAGTQWARESTRLAYFRSVGGPHTVAITDLTGHETVVSQPGEDAFNPVWSPDGNRLVYATEASGTVVVDVATRARQVLPVGLAECGATWAPDGTTLLGLGASCTELYRIPLSDPAGATRVGLPTGQINVATWQQLTP
jgi:Tol biopolymer transport system component